MMKCLLGFLIGAFLICVALGTFYQCAKQATYNAPPRNVVAKEVPSVSGVGLGDIVSLDIGPDRYIVGGVSMFALDDALRLLAARDNIGYHQLIRDGRIKELERHTRVRVIDIAASAYQVRVLEGTYARRALWVIREAANP